MFSRLETAESVRVPVRATVATTTAWGGGDPLDIVLERIAANTDATRIELSIGARPVADPIEVLARWADRFQFQAHHSAPIGAGVHIRPTISADPHAAVAAVVAAGCDRYSGHPPAQRDATWEQMIGWALRWWEACSAAGVHWSVETMYVPRTRKEHETSGGYWLTTPAEVWEFCRIMVGYGWTDPLLIDVSHLHIGWHGGQWTEGDICELLASAPASGAHVSMNDGRRDEHRPAGSDELAWRWLAPHADRFDWIVDEGKRHAGW